MRLSAGRASNACEWPCVKKHLASCTFEGEPGEQLKDARAKVDALIESSRKRDAQWDELVGPCKDLLAADDAVADNEDRAHKAIATITGQNPAPASALRLTHMKIDKKLTSRLLHREGRTGDGAAEDRVFDSSSMRSGQLVHKMTQGSMKPARAAVDDVKKQLQTAQDATNEAMSAAGRRDFEAVRSALEDIVRAHGETSEKIDAALQKLGSTCAVPYCRMPESSQASTRLLHCCAAHSKLIRSLTRHVRSGDDPSCAPEQKLKRNAALEYVTDNKITAEAICDKTKREQYRLKWMASLSGSEKAELEAFKANEKQRRAHSRKQASTSVKKRRQ